MIKVITIEELAVGHYVVDIVEQAGKFTLTRSGHIRNDKTLKGLKVKGVKSLRIDTQKTLKFKSTTIVPPSSSAESTHLDNPKIITDDSSLAHDTGEPVTGEITSASEIASHYSYPIILEINKAKKLFGEAKGVSTKVFDDVRKGNNIDIAPIIDITDKTIEAIFKNPDTLACVINIRHKSDYLLEHSVAVSILMIIFSRFLAIEKSIIEQLAIGAFLHDVGKVMIPDAIINKTSRFSDAEEMVMKSHVNHSIGIVKNTAGISPISLDVVALHHEKLDGSGYPYQLQAEDISLYGRMVSICDIYDALCSNRSYKKGFCHIKTVTILRNLAKDGQLDLRLVDSFIKCMGVYPVGSLVELASNKLAIVERRNPLDPISPKVRSFYNTDSKRYIMAKDINLAKNDDKIVNGVRAEDFNLDMNKIIEFLLLEG